MKRTMKVPFLSSLRSAGESAHETRRRTSSVATAAKAGAFVLGAVMLFGCPVYSGSQGNVTCDSQGQCCDESENCYVIQCDFTRQCPSNATCEDGVCASSYDGGGYYYDAGSFDGGTDATTDCSETGCPDGYTCTLTNGLAQCLPTEDGGSSDAGTDGTVSDSGAPDVVTPPADAGIDAPIIPPFTGCTSDSACATDGGAGALCLNGQCVAAVNECSDSTQCPTVGTTQEQCVAGVCTPACANGAACPTGYSCQTIGGSEQVCTGNPTPCGAADGGSACSSGTTCVDEHCVPTCTPGAGDAGPTCSGSGLVCVDNGCIPSQKPQFVCAGNDGTQSTCASGSICLHHNCYIACSLADAGADAGNSCRTAGSFNKCEAVATSEPGGPFDVCGSSSTFGTECDPTQGIACSNSRICIDGTCY